MLVSVMLWLIISSTISKNGTATDTKDTRLAKLTGIIDKSRPFTIRWIRVAYKEFQSNRMSVHSREAPLVSFLK